MQAHIIKPLIAVALISPFESHHGCYNEKVTKNRFLLNGRICMEAKLKPSLEVVVLIITAHGCTATG
jgi:hypothetical protein